MPDEEFNEHQLPPGEQGSGAWSDGDKGEGDIYGGREDRQNPRGDRKEQKISAMMRDNSTSACVIEKHDRADGSVASVALSARSSGKTVGTQFIEMDYKEDETIAFGGDVF